MDRRGRPARGHAQRARRGPPLSPLPLALVAAVAGAGVGYLTHRLNNLLATTEPEATEPALPGEPFWAPVLDAGLFGLVVYQLQTGVYTLPYAIALGVLSAVLVQVLVFDARHRLILNKVMYPAIFVALVSAPVNPLLDLQPGPAYLVPRLTASLGGAIVAGAVFFVIVLVSRGGVGLGDAKLAFFMGAVLGGLPLTPPPVARALFLGVIMGGVGAAILLLTRVRSMKDFIPYGPFLCAGAIITALLPPCAGAIC